MSKVIVNPRYLVVKPGDQGYQNLQDHFPDLGDKTVYTVVSGRLPNTLEITPINFMIARYYLDGIISGQGCVATEDGAANADVFFDQYCHIYQYCRIYGIQRIHALSHLLLAVIGDYTDEHHVTDRVFSNDSNNFYLSFSAELNIDKLHILVDRLWQDLSLLLKEGVIHGYIERLVFKDR